MSIEEIINIFTNGIGEKPYYRREDDQIIVYVADDQEFCRIPIDDCDEDIAKAICEVGFVLKDLQAKISSYACTRAVNCPLVVDIK